MSIGTDSEVGILTAGAPGRLGDPVGIFVGTAAVTGDATGGTLQHSFTINAGDESRFVFVIDSVHFADDDDAVNPGPAHIEIFHHHEQVGSLSRFRRSFGAAMVGAGVDVMPIDMGIWARQFPIWWRKDLGGTLAERIFATIFFATNVNLKVYLIGIQGRAYDARVLASAEFWSLFPDAGATARR